MLPLVEGGVVSPPVYPGAFDEDTEDGCTVETTSFVALIDVASVKVRVLPVNTEDVSGYGSICAMNTCIWLSAP